MQKPNILIFCTDEQCFDYLSCMGHPHVKTPNIDRIAENGTLFRNCYSSNPVCMPARATMFTGLTSRVHGVVNNGFDLDKGFSTLPGLLAESGYRTHAVGKLHLAGRGGREIDDHEDFSVHPERRIYWDWPGHWKGAHYRKFPDNYFGLQTVELVQGHVNYVFGDYVTWLEENHPGAYAGYKCSNADPRPLSIDPDIHYNKWISDRCIDFIDKHLGNPVRRERICLGQKTRNLSSGDPQESGIRSQETGVKGQGAGDSSQPFFLWCSFPDPHEPFAAVRKWSDFYDDVDVELSQNQLELSPHSRSETMTRLGLGVEVIDQDRLKKSIKQTYGMVSHIDEQVGRVLDALEEQGIAENTVVMFISDHGDQLGDHGLFYKSVYPYDRHMHIPFLVKVPRGVRGKVVDDVVSMLDMVPTALDLAGIEPDLPGEILTPVLVSDAAPLRKNALVEHDRTDTEIGPVLMRAIVQNDFKLVRYHPMEEVLLFDRRNDMQELNNLAKDPAHQGVVSELMELLDRELARTG